MALLNPTERRLVGRDSEIRIFDVLLDELGSGKSSVVVVSGEPGIGKTVLIGEVLARSRALGYETFSGRGSELERHVPFAAFVDALEAAAASISPRQRALLSRDVLVLAATVFPALENDREEPVGARPRDYDTLVLQALHALLKVLAHERPMVLALDDLHWADPTSVDLICRLLHRGLADRSLLLLASRPGQSEPRVRAAFAEAELHGNAHRIELGPLSAADAAALVGEELDRAVVKRLYRESGGNPFYLEQLAAAARRGATLSTDDSAPSEPSLPTSVGAAIRGELDCLSPTARALLQGAAVAGDPFDVDLAAHIAGISERNAVSATDELVERDLIRPDDESPRFRFRHPIVRRAVYETAGAGWRLQAHRRALATLEQRGAAPTILASHVERSANVGDKRAADILARAGEALISQAPTSAARWLDAALRLTPPDDRNTERCLELMTERAIALGWAGRLRESREELRRFLRVAPNDPSGLRLRAVSLYARVEEALGNPAAGRSLLLDELERLADRSGREAAIINNELAIGRYYAADWDGLVAQATVTLAADCTRTERVNSLALLGQAELCLGNFDRARGIVAEAAELFDQLDAEELDPSTAVWLGDAEVGSERFAEGARHVQRAAAIFGTGRRSWSVPLYDVLSSAQGFAGQVVELGATAESAIEAALLTSSDVFLSTAMAMRSNASLFAGDIFSALRFAERSVAYAETVSVEPIEYFARSAFAWALIEAGEPQRCQEQLTRPDGEVRVPPIAFVQGARYEHLVRAEIALGNLDRADELAARARRVAEPLRTGAWGVHARRATAYVALARGDTKVAVAEATAAVENAEAAGAPIEAGRGGIIAGRALAASGDRAAAVAMLRSAYETLHDCGEVLYRDQAARELRMLGRAVPSTMAPRDGKARVHGLTGRESEVMELVAAGRTNREIADNLVLSVRTVERHVARIFEKLDVHSRTAASTVFFERTRNDDADQTSPSDTLSAAHAERRDR
jgi:ATP/maltotriose-dependent transcriptional regulator MalT